MKHKFSYLYAIIFIIVCYVLLPIMNSDYLFALQEQSFWTKGHTFMSETVNDYGWLAYIGAYLTQYLYYPWLGSTILILSWVFICFLLNRIFNLSDKFAFVPYLAIFNLPLSVLSLGYWIYYSKDPGYAFVPTINVLAFAIVFFVLNLLLRKIKNKPFNYCKIATIVLMLCAYLPKYHEVKTTLFDKNFHRELRMYKAIDECRYEDVLAEAPKMTDADKEHPTNLMVMLRNVALLNTGQLIETLFDYDNTTVLPQTSDSLHVRLASQAGPMLYYQYGFINYAYRWAIESFVKQNMSFDKMKMLIRCAIFNHEVDVAIKYISILKSSTFHRKWALEHEAMLLDSRLFVESTEYINISPLISQENILDDDDANVMLYILDSFSNFNTSAQPIEELSITSSLMLQAEEETMIHFYNFAQNHPQMDAPIAAQEAAILLGPTELSPIDVSGYPFSDDIKSRFLQFTQEYNRQKSDDESAKASELAPQFGTSYWWYYTFHPDFKYY